MRLLVFLTALTACSAPTFDARIQLLADPAQDPLANAAVVEIRLRYPDGQIVSGTVTPRNAEGEIPAIPVSDGIIVDVVARTGDDQGGEVVALGRSGPLSLGPDAPTAAVFIARPDSIAAVEEALVEGRAFAQSCWLPGDRVAVIGGGNGGSETLDAVELIGRDPDGPLRAERAGEIERIGHQALLIREGGSPWDGRVLVLGGTTRAGDDTLEGGWEHGDAAALLWDPATETSEVLDPLPFPMMDHRAVLTAQGLVATLGGYYSSEAGAQYMTQVVTVGPDGTEEQPVTILMREQHQVTPVRADGSGGFLITGGFSGTASTRKVELWSGFPEEQVTDYPVAGQLQLPRARHQATRVRDGVILVSGGTTLTNAVADGEPLRYLERWTLEEEAFVQQVASLQTARQRHVAFVISGGRVLMCGGQDTTGASLTTCEVWDDSAATVSPWDRGDLTFGGPGVSAAPFPDGLVLLVGGVAGPGAPSTEIHLYMPATLP